MESWKIGQCNLAIVTDAISLWNRIPDNRGDITSRLYDHIRANRLVAKDYQDDYLSIRYFMKGTAHIVFSKPELIDRMNELIAKHCPEMLVTR
ncbi:DUF4942 domain-containing protein [Serratia fonticola]